MLYRRSVNHHTATQSHEPRRTHHIVPQFVSVVWVRNIQGAGTVETFLLVSISTILITRGYLELTDYPQVGGGPCTSLMPSTEQSLSSWSSRRFCETLDR